MIKKLFTLFICTLSLAATFTSCGDEAIDVESVNKQTIFVFYPWTGGTNTSGLTSFLENNVDSICEGIVAKKGLNNSRVMVFMSQNYRKSYLIDLQYDGNTKTVIRDTLKTYDEATYTTAEGFAEILNEVKRRAEALNYSLIIGAHGCGWTYKSDWVNYPYMARPNAGFAQKGSTSYPTATGNFCGIQYGPDPNKPITRFFGSVSLEENALDVPTLAEGIKLSGTKMQYILFDACYMGNVETAYELKDVTNFMISSSSEVMGAGVPYKTIWSYLNSSAPNYSGFVNGVVNFYGQSSPSDEGNQQQIYLLIIRSARFHTAFGWFLSQPLLRYECIHRQSCSERLSERQIYFTDETHYQSCCSYRTGLYRVNEL